VARSIHQAAECVGCAHRHVHHDSRGLASGQEVAVRHGDGDAFVWRDEKFRNRYALLPRMHEGLDDRGEIRAGVGERAVDAARMQGLQEVEGNAVTGFFHSRRGWTKWLTTAWVPGVSRFLMRAWTRAS